MDVPLTQIRVGQRARSLNEKALSSLMDSIKSVGMQMPISILAEPNDSYLLVTGLHRLEACRRLGLTEIDAKVVDLAETERRLWEISENLHRAELTALERSEHIAEWIRFYRERTEIKGAKNLHPGGEQPHDQGISAASREFNLERSETQRAAKIAALEPEAKEEAKALKLDDHQSALLEASKAPSKEQQIRALREKATQKAQKPAKPAEMPPKEVKPRPLTNSRDEWVGLTVARLKADRVDTLHALAMMVRDDEEANRKAVSEHTRRELIGYFSQGLGFRFADPAGA